MFGIQYTTKTLSLVSFNLISLVTKKRNKTHNYVCACVLNTNQQWNFVLIHENIWPPCIEQKLNIQIQTECKSYHILTYICMYPLSIMSFMLNQTLIAILLSRHLIFTHSTIIRSAIGIYIFYICINDHIYIFIYMHVYQFISIVLYRTIYLIYQHAN